MGNQRDGIRASESMGLGRLRELLTEGEFKAMLELTIINYQSFELDSKGLSSMSNCSAALFQHVLERVSLQSA